MWKRNKSKRKEISKKFKKTIIFLVLFYVFLFDPSCFFLVSEQVMDRNSSSASTVLSLDDDFVHNMRNPLLDLLFLEQVSGIFASNLVDIDLARFALSCQFALDLLCYKEVAYDSAWRFIGHHCPWSFSFFVAPMRPLRHRDYFMVDASLQILPAFTSTCVEVFVKSSIDGVSKCPLAKHWGSHRLGWREFDLHRHDRQCGWPRNDEYTSSTNCWNLCHTAQNARVVRRVCYCHLHELMPESA